jgi:membrane-bound lytic murein transglycosylase B
MAAFMLAIADDAELPSTMIYRGLPKHALRVQRQPSSLISAPVMRCCSRIGLSAALGLTATLSPFDRLPLAIPAAWAQPGAPQSASPEEVAQFHAFLESLYPEAAKRGVGRDTFRAAFEDLTPDPSVARATGQQSEFERPFAAYFAGAVAQRRISEGRALAHKYQAQLAAISRRTGVPGAMLLAAWGMESDFGRSMGDKDIIRSLATLAFRQPERSLFRDELIDALVILAKGKVPRSRLKGSWAGAMGGPQFMPSSYLTHAVSYAGGNAPDIWTDAPDILASIAAFLRAAGWRPGQRWGLEVRVPQGFRYATLHADFRQWAAWGFKGADGSALPQRGEASLFFPAGAKGPAFLLGDNYWVIKTYNNSDAYALSFACLADRIAGSNGLHAAWPKDVPQWRSSEKAEMQRILQRLGYYKGTIDGKFGPSARDAIHAFQIAVGDQPADGIGGANLLSLLRAKAH